MKNKLLLPLLIVSQLTITAMEQESDQAMLNQRYQGGQTLLIMATTTKSISYVKELLKLGVRTDIVDHNGNTALDIAEKKGYKRIAELLKNAGAQRASKTWKCNIL